MTSSPVPRVTVRLRHDGGHVTLSTPIVTDVRAAVRTLLACERAPERAVVWVRRRPTCETCDQPATRYAKGGQETPLCSSCAANEYGADRRASVGELGITRFLTVDPAEWRSAA